VNPLILNTSVVKRKPEAPVKSKPDVDIETTTHVESLTADDSFVYVHCYFQNKWQNMLIRIWKTTFLVDGSSGTRARLIHAENISMAPAWTQIPDGREYSFLLIFSGLPKSCKTFDLVEEISEPGGFFVRNISRNETDVYHIDVGG
jgi:hypothetical protein